jgi:Cof subfamily protein (haloacid dehalogenase superfamily)
MDGTLLNSIGEIPSKNVDAIKKAVGMGLEFAIVTGRPYTSVKELLKSNGITCSVIGCNGAQVTDKQGNLVRAHYINRDSLYMVMKEAEERDVYYQLYDDRYIYTRSRLQLLKMLKNYSGKSIRKHINLRRIIGGIKRLFFIEVKVIRNLIKFASREGNRFYKLQIASLSQEELNSLRDVLKSIPDIDITSSNYFNIEIGPKGVTKGTALHELARINNITPEEIIAVGDNYNDIPMLEYAGCGVAMENAEQGVKDRADFFAKSNDDAGVAYAIEKLVFNDQNAHI